VDDSGVEVGQQELSSAAVPLLEGVVEQGGDMSGDGHRLGEGDRLRAVTAVGV
jgi:hypothetical protein